MKLIDIFSKKVRDEKKKYGWRKLPDYVITSEFLEFFPNEKLREYIYNSSYITTRENYDVLIELSKINKNFGIEAAKQNIVLGQEELEKFKELNKYDFDFLQILEHGNKILEYKNKYGDIVIPYLKKDYDLYSNVINLFSSDLDLKWCLDNQEDFLNFSKFDSSSREYMKKFLNKGRLDDYQKVKKLIEKGYDLYVLEMLEYYNFDQEIINLLDNKKIKSQTDILRISSLDIKLRQIYDLKCDYEINKCLDKNEIEQAISILNQKYFVVYSKKEIDEIFKSLNSVEINEYLREMYNKLIKLNSLKDKEEILTFMKENDGVLDRFKFDFELGKCLNQDLNKIAFNPKNYNFTIKEGVKIIDFDNNDLSKFNMVVHVISDRSKDRAPNGKFSLTLPEHPELWGDRSVKASDTLSCSMISEYHMKLFGHVRDSYIILGFSDFDKTSILGIYPGDHGANMEGNGKIYNYDDDYGSIFNSPTQTLPSKILDGKEKINYCNLSYNGYNELTFGRNENGVSKKPEYILSLINFGDFKDNKPIDETAIKWAKYYNIPIVQIDGEKLRMQAHKKINKLLSDWANKIVTKEDFSDFLKIRRTLEITTYKAFNIYDVLINVIDKNMKFNSIESINETLQIIQNYGDLISNDIIIEGNPKIYADNIALYEQRKQIINNKLQVLENMKSNLENSDSYTEKSSFSM